MQNTENRIHPENQDHELTDNEPKLWQQVSVIAGGFLVALNVGVMYLWGIILNYITSYFRVLGDTSLTSSSGGIVLPLAFFGMACSTPFSIKLVQNLGTRLSIIVVGYLFAIFILISSYMSSFGLFVLFYAILGGLCHGPLYIITLAHGYKFIKTKSIVSGFVASGIGIGTLLFSQVLVSKIINPNNLSVKGYYQNTPEQKAVAQNVPTFLRYLALSISILITIGTVLLVDQTHKHQNQKSHGLNVFNIHHHVDQQHVNTKQNLRQSRRQDAILKADQIKLKLTKLQYDRLKKQHQPMALLKKRTLNLDEIHHEQKLRVDQGEEQVDIIISKNQLILDRNRAKSRRKHQSQLNEEIEQMIHSDQCVYLWNAFKTKIFWITFSLCLLGSNMGLFTSGNYKRYGHLFIQDQSILTLAGSIGSVSNGIFRILFGLILTIAPFRFVYPCMLIIGIALAVTFQFTVKSQTGIILYLIGIYGCYAGNYTLFPTIALKIFGKHIGASIYSFLFMAFALTNFLQFIYSNTILVNYPGQVGFMIVYYVQAGMMILALVIYFTMFQEEWDWRPLNKEYLQKIGVENYQEKLQQLS